MYLLSLHVDTIASSVYWLDFDTIASSVDWFDYSTLLFNCPYCRKFLFKLPSTNRKKCLEGHHFGVIFGCFEKGGNGGTQQPWVFLLKTIILGCEMGVPPFTETPKFKFWRLFFSWGPSMPFYTKTTPENNIPSKNAGPSGELFLLKSHPAFTGGDGRKNFSHHKTRTRNFNELILYQKWMVFLEHGSRSGFKYVHFWYLFVEFQGGTLDGRNPAPGDMENIPLFTWFYTSQVVVWISSINSITKMKRPRYL